MKMNPGLVIFIKLALIYSLSFELGMTLFEYFGYSFLGDKPYEFVLWKSLFRGLGYGLIMAGWNLWSFKKDLKKKGFNEITDEITQLRHETEFTTTYSREEILRRIKKSPVIRKFNIQNDQITIKTNYSGRSPLGEVVNIALTNDQDQDQVNKVFVSSRPYSRFTILDYGINKGNIIGVEKLLKA